MFLKLQRELADPVAERPQRLLWETCHDQSGFRVLVLVMLAQPSLGQRRRRKFIRRMGSGRRVCLRRGVMVGKTCMWGERGLQAEREVSAKVKNCLGEIERR